MPIRLWNTSRILHSEHEIKTEFYLVGSGAKNLVTRDGNGPFDLDYNLRILEMPNRCWNDLKNLKDTVRDSLNRIVKKTLFSDGQDSKSVITSNLVLKNAPQKEFSFDIAILARMGNGNLCRLIHNKQNGLFTWCEVPCSKDLGGKVLALKQHGWWGDVRETYLKKRICTFHAEITITRHLSCTWKRLTKYIRKQENN